jgi:hypothetical protein
MAICQQHVMQMIRNNNNSNYGILYRLVQRRHDVAVDGVVEVVHVVVVHLIGDQGQRLMLVHNFIEVLMNIIGKWGCFGVDYLKLYNHAVPMLIIHVVVVVDFIADEEATTHRVVDHLDVTDKYVYTKSCHNYRSLYSLTHNEITTPITITMVGITVEVVTTTTTTHTIVMTTITMVNFISNVPIMRTIKRRMRIGNSDVLVIHLILL